MRNSVLYRRIQAFRMVKEAQDRSIKARVLDWDDPAEKLGYQEIEVDGVAYKLPKNTKPNEIMISENISQTELLGHLTNVVNKEQNIKDNDPPDQYIEFGTWDRKRKEFYNSNINYPDGWRKPIFPAGKSSPTDTSYGKKPNIQMIRQWVDNVKLAGKSQMELEKEYNVMYDQDSIKTGWTKEKMDRLINSIAFVVARKIWYVGRKPSGMSDTEWDNDTRHMRPNDQSYSTGQKGRKYGDKGTVSGGSVKIFDQTENWGNNGNPYVQDEYSYTSGDPDERGRKK